MHSHGINLGLSGTKSGDTGQSVKQPLCPLDTAVSTQAGACPAAVLPLLVIQGQEQQARLEGTLDSHPVCVILTLGEKS